ncbi:MAG TPA: S8 family peptidase [Vicinamibacterales bacterium]|nr:S8 family peptidase [Vicinamibacterales bacterium]
MTFWRNKRTWLAAMLAVVFAWATPAFAGGPKLDGALQSKLKRTAGAGEYRVIIETVEHGNAEALIRQAGGKAGRTLVSFPSQVAVVSAMQLAKLERHPLIKVIYLDRPTAGEMTFASMATGALTSRALMGYSGAGVGVAIIDSGITSWHDDLTFHGMSSAVPVVGGQRVTAFVDFVNGQTAPYDDNGHGTHVAGVIAGNGYDSLGFRAGIAPSAHLVSLKVLDGQSVGYMSDVIAAIDWSIANKAAHNIRVLNLSVGAPVTMSYNVDPLALAAKRAVDAGIVVVAAAGNRGRNADGESQYGGITAPGNAPWVLTVGASSHNGTLARGDDTIASYSSRGPTAVDFLAKPDLVAPGTGIVSLAVAGSTLYEMQSSFLVDGFRSTAYRPYIALSGTSMAAPVVSGTVALMMQANPSLTPNAVKAILQYTAEERAYDSLTQGAGFLNTYGAVTLAKYFRVHPEGSRYPTSPFWSKAIIWGNHKLKGGAILPAASAWDDNIVWGTAFDAEGDNIVWGTIVADLDNIVWGTQFTLDATGDNIVWGTAADLDNIVWGTLIDSLDNIVWGTVLGDDNIVWGTDCGGADCTGVVWGAAMLTESGDNIVWGTAADGDNIVWGTAIADLDNIVWGTAADLDNIVWGTANDDNIVWGTATDDNIVWGTVADDNIVWGTDTSTEEAIPVVPIESLFGVIEAAPATESGTSPTPVTPITTTSTDIMAGGI